jgi:hypothetical protein
MNFLQVKDEAVKSKAVAKRRMGEGGMDTLDTDITGLSDLSLDKSIKEKKTYLCS